MSKKARAGAFPINDCRQCNCELHHKLIQQNYWYCDDCWKVIEKENHRQDLGAVLGSANKRGRTT